MTQFEEKYLPKHTDYFFRVPVEPEESYQVEIQIYKKSIIEFNLGICGFVDRPSDMESITGHSGCFNNLLGKIESEGDYDKYLYDFETGDGIKYLSIYMENKYALDFLSFSLKKKHGN